MYFHGVRVHDGGAEAWGGCRSRKLRAHILNYKHEGWGIGGEERRREGKREMEGGRRREGRMEGG